MVGQGAEFGVGTEAGDWLVVAVGRGPAEVGLITTMGLTTENKTRESGREVRQDIHLLTSSYLYNQKSKTLYMEHKDSAFS